MHLTSIIRRGTRKRPVNMGPKDQFTRSVKVNEQEDNEGQNRDFIRK